MWPTPLPIAAALQVAWVSGHGLSICLALVQSSLASSCQQSFQAAVPQEAACEELHTAGPLLQKASAVHTRVFSSITLLHVVAEAPASIGDSTLPNLATVGGGM